MQRVPHDGGWRAKGASGEQKFRSRDDRVPLTGAHIHTPCVGCHMPPKPSSALALRVTMTPTAAASCVVRHLHTPAGWRVARPLEMHRMTRFPLTGMHVLADCSQCHLRASEQRWTDAPVDCYACHQKDYRRPDIFPVHQGTATSDPLPRDCSLCHRAIAWVPAAQPIPRLRPS